jgi:hypothetical protein
MSEEDKESTQKEKVEELIFENKNINALIKGVEVDLALLQKENVNKERAGDIVRFTIELNILKDKKARNLRAINKIIESKK